MSLEKKLISNTMSKRNKPSKHRICCFCRLSENNELEFGKFYEDGEIVTHYYCLLLSSNMQQRGKDDEGILGFLKTDIKKEISRGKRLVCSYCKKAGATLGCCNVKCKKIFHYPCGLRAGTLNQFFDEFRSYCIKHRPKQKIDARVKIELSKTNKVVCCICYDEVDPYDTVGTMWAPCCKKNAWFHRKCVQQLALSAGYFFKCPLCNNKNLFQKAMSEFGIFIPSQDASWELVPNAFEELLYRHDQCNAPICLCPKGRKYTSCNAKWELALCRTCGSQGTHMACGQLKWANPVWECRECISILGKSKVTASSSTTKDTLQNVSDFEDSDSDISVGKDSPIPFTSSSPLISSASQSPIVKQRPGPRSFKLRQLKLIEEMQNNNKYRTNENINTMLDPANMEKHSLQSTSTKESFMSVSNSVTASMFHNYEDSSNSSIWHSKSQLDKQVDIITLDSDDDIIECDEDGGISPVVESSNRSFTNDTRINCIEKSITLDHSKPKRSQVAEQWKPQNDVEMLILKQHRTSNNKFHNMCWQGKSESTDSNYSQLIPEYVCLRDLKFRVSNINNLQMILYDKYSVNINMECVTTTRENTTFDVPIKKVAPQCIFKTQNDTLLNFRCGNIYSNKDKNTSIFVNEYSEHDQDDIKENLDPVITIPCKNTKDDLLINATLVTNNPNVFTNNNNQSENKTVEHNDGGRNHETIRLSDDIKNNFDAITSCNHNYGKSINDVEQNIQNLNFDDIIDKTYEIHNMKKGLKTDFKVSIDLKKIKCFVDDNPNLFSRYKKEDSKRCNQQANFLKEQNNIQRNFNSSEHVKNSSMDESKHDENFTLSTSKYVIKELTSHNTETEKD